MYEGHRHAVCRRKTKGNNGYRQQIERCRIESHKIFICGKVIQFPGRLSVDRTLLVSVSPCPYPFDPLFVDSSSFARLLFQTRTSRGVGYANPVCRLQRRYIEEGLGNRVFFARDFTCFATRRIRIIVYDRTNDTFYRFLTDSSKTARLFPWRCNGSRNFSIDFFEGDLSSSEVS